MTLSEIAKIYTDLVSVDNGIPESEHVAKDAIGALRTKFHQMFMDKLEEEGIEFTDRFDAMNMAFDIVKKELIMSARKELAKNLEAKGVRTLKDVEHMIDECRSTPL
jgi:hypothetical protein